MKLEFHTPEAGDWLVIINSETGEEVYSGHGSGDQLDELLAYLGVEYSKTEHPDQEYEEKFC